MGKSLNKDLQLNKSYGGDTNTPTPQPKLGRNKSYGNGA